MQFADLAGRRHLVLKVLPLTNKSDMHVTGHSSTQFNLALRDPSYVNLLNTAQHHFCLLPNTAIDCSCPNL